MTSTPSAAVNPPDTDWQWSTFAELGSRDLYAMLAQRQEVFVLEQECLFQDIDGIDLLSHHLLAWQTHDGVRVLAAYLRCVPPGVTFPDASIGRVLTSRPARGSGLGKLLFAEGVRRTVMTYPTHAIRISAQQYLEDFYTGFGFVTCSEPYLEDDILHVEMVRPVP